MAFEKYTVQCPGYRPKKDVNEIFCPGINKLCVIKSIQLNPMMMKKYLSKSYRAIMVLIFLFLFAAETICQVAGSESKENPLKSFVGD
ncbi:hypothetical protein [Membranihabitans maritimus]|uniref:hypothetical protein n=1 Tax=Membranihabitans maritimus TaxID=2904244 RepID=UPI001F2F1499|nr:hypothetical protein [Membranihabitans maritimus]